jgi:hypothetical protein
MVAQHVRHLGDDVFRDRARAMNWRGLPPNTSALT